LNGQNNHFEKLSRFVKFKENMFRPSFKHKYCSDLYYILFYLEISEGLVIYLESLDVFENLMANELKKEFAKASLENLNADDYFEKVGWIALMQEDLFLQKAKLFFTMEAYKDIIEPPKELTDQIKKELEDVSFEQMFSIIDGERKITNKDKYNARKKEYFIQVENLKKQLNGTDAS
jgi:hypothetical protein